MWSLSHFKRKLQQLHPPCQGICIINSPSSGISVCLFLFVNLNETPCRSFDICLRMEIQLAAAKETHANGQDTEKIRKILSPLGPRSLQISQSQHIHWLEQGLGLESKLEDVELLESCAYIHPFMRKKMSFYTLRGRKYYLK